MPVKIAIYLLVYLGVPVAASMIPNETARSVLGIIYILLLIPFGIVKTIEYYRTNEGTTRLSRIFNTLFRVPLALFGLVCLLAGLSLIGWVLYNVFIKRLKEYSGPRFVMGLGSFGFGVPLVLYGWYTLRSVFRRKENVVLTPEEREEFEREEEAEDPGEKPNGSPN